MLHHILHHALHHALHNARGCSHLPDRASHARLAALRVWRQAVSAAPDDARPPLTLGRYLAKLSRPAEAIEQFYDAALLNADYFDEVRAAPSTPTRPHPPRRDPTHPDATPPTPTGPYPPRWGGTPEPPRRRHPCSRRWARVRARLSSGWARPVRSRGGSPKRRPPSSRPPE
jgi:hypothetical protein